MGEYGVAMVRGPCLVVTCCVACVRVTDYRFAFTLYDPSYRLSLRLSLWLLHLRVFQERLACIRVSDGLDGRQEGCRVCWGPSCKAPPSDAVDPPPPLPPPFPSTARMISGPPPCVEHELHL